LDEYRKQGYGTELVKQSLNYEINHKRNKFMLTASELGLIIYKKLGFKPMDVYYQYSIKGK
ncbi:MAG: GNAT family N-acetyltransferase, partial [Alphaproteobacteria bacterium]|nr:GNAT family N-acetyltransferase [Alphaproteobacteria bacterium]